MNIVVIEGSVVRNPELQRTSTGKYLLRFTVACDAAVNRNKGEKHTDFINCVAWGGYAERIKSLGLSKGDTVFVQGEIRTGNYINKKGDKVYTTDVLVSHIDFKGNVPDQHNGNVPEQYVNGPNGGYSF